MSLKLTSPAFEDGNVLPQRFTLDGANVSPPLTWKGVPSACVSLALVCEDLDARKNARVHWVLYGIPAKCTALEDGLPQVAKVNAGICQGKNDFQSYGYVGPSPRSGVTHHYRITLYALDGNPVLGEKVTKRDLLRAMNGLVIDRAHMTGTRPASARSRVVKRKRRAKSSSLIEA